MRVNGGTTRNFAVPAINALHAGPPPLWAGQSGAVDLTGDADWADCSYCLSGVAAKLKLQCLPAAPPRRPSQPASPSAKAKRMPASGKTGRAAGDPPEDSDESRIADLIMGNHILAHEDVLDGFGHVSVRSVKDPEHYYMSRSLAPELVSREDVMEFNARSEPVDQQGRGMYLERFIHGEIFAARPDVQAVVHSHSPDVLPFAVTKAPLKALIHVAAFLGDKPAPVFEIRDVLGDDNRILVTEPRTGAALARTLDDRAVVLMRGHGMTVVASSVRLAVMRAIYTQLNARIETKALQFGEPVFLNAQESLRTDPIDRPWQRWVARAQAGK